MKYALLTMLILSSGCGAALGTIHRTACVICNLGDAAKFLCLESGLKERACANPEILAEYEKRVQLAMEGGKAAAMSIMMDSMEK